MAHCFLLARTVSSHLQKGVHHEEQEKLVVEDAHGVVDPGAVVVQFDDAAPRHAVVVGALRLEGLAAAAPAALAPPPRDTRVLGEVVRRRLRLRMSLSYHGSSGRAAAAAVVVVVAASCIIHREIVRRWLFWWWRRIPNVHN